MTILSSTVGNVANQSVDKSVWIKAARLRQGTVTGSVVVPERIEVKPVAGVLTTPELQPGPAVVTWGIDTYYVTIPASGTVSWWSVLALAVGVPPGTSEESIAEALAVYLDANPIEGGGLTVDQIATAATTSTPLKAALDQSYAPFTLRARVIDQAGEPILTKAADIVLDANGEIDDIIIRTVS
ncbi:hypothetical protein [Rhodococcus sp. Leaf233]|uniref:hypothetical protein n=1 Tax=Rhodococcus sp. Leaf233 TaxID=1736302 RepID=UPI00070C566F|nr:hypothetical protein [Rhodococcus sp. Leaf233]KQU33582.1 hypothetical protein ASH04_07045 [Rhodococcus sp. Leaf233]